MNLNRRQFLQMLATVTAAAGLPLSATGEAIEQAQAALPVAADLLYAPVTKRNPLCWIELDGVRYDCRSLHVEQRVDAYEYRKLGSSFDETVQGPTRTEITFSAYWSTEINKGILSKALKVPTVPVPFSLGGIGVPGVLSGEAVRSEVNVSHDFDGYVMVKVSMYVPGSITGRWL